MELRKKRLKCPQLAMGVAMNGTCIYIKVLRSLHMGANGACQGDDKYMYIYSCLLTN